MPPGYFCAIKQHETNIMNVRPRLRIPASHTLFGRSFRFGTLLFFMFQAFPGTGLFHMARDFNKPLHEYTMMPCAPIRVATAGNLQLTISQMAIIP